MFRRNKWLALVWLLAIASLPLRVANAHLHLCLDGQQAAVSLHTEDAPSHFDTEDSAPGHDDRDVDIPSPPAVKLDAVDHIAFACVFVCGLQVEIAAPRAELPAADALPPLGSYFELRPPSRGPPV